MSVQGTANYFGESGAQSERGKEVEAGPGEVQNRPLMLGPVRSAWTPVHERGVITHSSCGYII